MRSNMKLVLRVAAFLTRQSSAWTQRKRSYNLYKIYFFNPEATIFASYLNSITGLVNLVLNSITGLVKHLDAIQHETCFTCCSILDKAIVCLNSKKAVIQSLQDLLFLIQKQEKKMFTVHKSWILPIVLLCYSPFWL